MESLDLQFSRENAVVLFTVKGRVDGNSSDHFGQHLTETIVDEDKVVILDLTALVFISSAGMRQFMKLAKRLNKLKLKAHLVGSNTTVAQTFEIAGFKTLFHWNPTVDSVLNPDAKQPRKTLFLHYFTRNGK